MTAPIRIPDSNEVLAVVRTQADLVEAFRKMKAMLGMTNAHCDELGGLADGGTDHYLGPSCRKEIGALTFNKFCWLFAVQFEMRIDPEQMRFMAEHWDDRKRLRPPEWSENGRVSQKLLEKAKPLILSQHGKEMNVARNSKLPSELRAKIARKAGKKRMRKVTKTERSAMARKGWETRRRNLIARAALASTAA